MNQNNIPCDTVRDLFPSYIDRLTSDTTNQLIEAHIATCAKCAGILNSMRSPETVSSTISEKQSKEIDFLKKNKKRNIKIIIGSIAGAIALVIAILLLKTFVIGEADYSGMVATRVEVSGSDVTLTAVPIDSIHAISDLTFEEEDGVVTVRARAVVMSFLHRGDLRREFTASTKIHRIQIGGQIIWEDGAPVYFFTSQVYKTRHDYMGSIPDNLSTAEALSMSRYLGSFTNELKTTQKPYVWRIILDKAVPEKERAVREADMERFAYVLLGVIGNLDEVEYAYTVDGENIIKSITAQNATEFLGRNIKDCGRSPRILGDLLNKTGLDAYAMGLAKEYYIHENPNVTLNLVNFTEYEIQSIIYSIYSDGSLISGGGICNADNSPISKNSETILIFERGDFGNGENVVIELGIEMPDGKNYTVNKKIRVPAKSGAKTTLKLCGNTKDGFRIEQ